MSIEHSSVADLAAAALQPCETSRRLQDARALHAAAVMLMTEGLERDFHYFALNLRVAIVELEDQMGALAPPSQRLTPLSDLPKNLRCKPEVSDAMAQIIRGGQT
jgi:hypothetical protein